MVGLTVVDIDFLVVFLLFLCIFVHFVVDFCLFSIGFEPLFIFFCFIHLLLTFAHFYCRIPGFADINRLIASGSGVIITNSAYMEILSRVIDNANETGTVAPTVHTYFL